MTRVRDPNGHAGSKRIIAQGRECRSLLCWDQWSYLSGVELDGETPRKRTHRGLNPSIRAECLNASGSGRCP